MDNICNISVMAVIHGVSEGEGRRGEKNGLLLPLLILILSTALTHTFYCSYSYLHFSYLYFLLIILILSTAYALTFDGSFSYLSYFFLLILIIREGFKKSKWKFKMAFAMKGGGGLEWVSSAIYLF